MFNPSEFTIFSLAGVLCIFLCLGDSSTKRCVETDKQALLKLKDGFVDEGHNLLSWKSEVDCCKWNGISCNNLTGHVITLDLQPFNLRGNIDSSLCELQHLTSLNLSYSFFEGKKIPKCIGSLNQLRELKLVDAGFVGTIPHELKNLSNLQTLDLGYNDNLIANDLEWISHLSSLRFLDLKSVDLSQAIDWQSSLSIIISSLIELHLDDCRLPQVTPTSLFHMNSSTSLQVLTLGRNFLNSSIPYWMFNNSKVLVHLDLSDNTLQHIVPDVFTNMTSLEYLDLSLNNLENSKVKFIYNLCQLKELWMSGNNLSGQLSDWMQQLCCVQNNIETLDLSSNNLSGPLPEFSGSLSLAALFLSNNQLNGNLPRSLGQLSSLVKLSLSSNKLNGVISEGHLSTLSSLKFLDVSHNNISFDFNSNWVPSFQLRGFFASSCILGPNFPVWLKYQGELDYLDISDGAISDSIPQWFWLSLSLSYLNISHNKIHGMLPKSLPKIELRSYLSSYIWDLSFNNLSGPLPHFPPNASVLLLSNNMFSGSISSFCATSQVNLEYLDLSSNLLSGRLLDCWGQLRLVKVLNLAKNKFSGRIPNSIVTLEEIKTIHLSNNNLSGEMPYLMPSPKLQFIDFGQNNLQGNLPTWIGHNLPNLIGLRLQANKLQGSIPTSLCSLVHLHILDLSQNNITGIIPHCLENLKALSNMTFARKTISYVIEAFGYIGVPVIPLFIDNAMLAWKGEDIEYDKNLGLMTTIDLSCNHLKGEIPSSITTLIALASLNLSRNNLTGFIPDNIGQMKMLESLDLSRNSLFGEIPASFSALSFLSCLNVSFNNLLGKIPQTAQLQTFDASSYRGNQGLCGPPLSKGCPGDGSSNLDPKSNHNIDADGDDKLISFGFYVSFVFGFIIGFWGVFGTLIVKSSWRHAYFRFFNNLNDWIYVQVVVFVARMKRRFQGNR